MMRRTKESVDHYSHLAEREGSGSTPTVSTIEPRSHQRLGFAVPATPRDPLSIRISDQKQTTRFRPFFLAWYIAWSAREISVSMSDPSAGYVHTPMLRVTWPDDWDPLP